MPRQYEVIDARRHRLRHIFPSSTGAVTVLGRTYGFRELPISYQTSSPDFAEGTWTARREDAGEWSVTFPNVRATDGFLWRDRFQTAGHLEFVEIYRDDVLEHVGCVQKIQRDRGQVVVSGNDGFYLLKSAYERDFLTVMAPRDVIERAGRVQVPVVMDDFLTFNASTWSLTGTLAESVANSFITLTQTDTVNAQSMVTQSGLVSIDSTSAWSLTVSGIQPVTGPVATLKFTVETTGGTALGQVVLWAGNLDHARLLVGGNIAGNIPLDSSFQAPYAVALESDGRWVRAFVNGRLIGYYTALAATTAQQIKVELNHNANFVVQIDAIRLRQQKPFLLGRGSDKGDYRLPGDATTYPAVGLHGRYYNDLDLQADTLRISKVLSPARTSYSDRLDPGVGSPVAPTPGASTTNWSARWFGAVYLKFSLGDYVFRVVSGASLNSAYRLWVAKTQLGDQILDAWSFATGRSTDATLLASTFGSKDGWYPIILEAAIDTGTGTSVTLRWNAPGAYTDPGGTSIVTGFGAIPASSLSPLGCVDQRFQGVSHFDMAQKTALDFGYQFTPEPMQLESGEFPCRVAPRVQVGRPTTDVVLEPDDDDQREPITNYQSLEDATDQASSIQGTGAGNADGAGSQINTEVADVGTTLASLFDLQAWVDAADIAFPSLLQARLNGQLGLQLAPWFNVTGDPRAQDRLADTFPMTGALAAMRWRPGDGVKLAMPDIGVIDTVCRPIMQVTRTFGPHGRTGTQVGFRQRPKGDAYIARKLTYAALRPQRARQPQPVPLTSSVMADSIAAAGFGTVAIVPLLPGDTIIKAIAWIAWASGAATSVDLEINSTLQGANLGGPWTMTATPTAFPVDILQFATATTSTDNRLLARLKNTGASTATFNLKLILTVLR